MTRLKQLQPRSSINPMPPQKARKTFVQYRHPPSTQSSGTTSHNSTHIVAAKKGPSTKKSDAKLKTQRKKKKGPPKTGADALRNIRHLQRTVDLQIPKVALFRLVKEIIQQVAGEGYRMKSIALDAIREAIEIYLVNLFQDAALCSIHAKRVTLFNTDIQLVRRLRNEYLV